MGTKLMGLRPSPAIVVAVMALVAAIAGTAVAGPGATTSKITKKKVTKIADNEINKLAPKIANDEITKRAPDLSVAHATTANQATTANNATNAETAANANALSGNTIVAEGNLDGPGLVTNSSCTTVSKQVPGVQASDHVIVTPPDAWVAITAEISFLGSINAPTENLRYTICNLSGVNQNFGTSPPVRFLVIR